MPAFDRGDVYLPLDAPWLDEYLRELLGFPNTPHDDQIDSTSQFFTWLQGWSKPTLKLGFCDEDDED